MFFKNIEFSVWETNQKLNQLFQDLKRQDKNDLENVYLLKTNNSFIEKYLLQKMKALFSMEAFDFSQKKEVILASELNLDNIEESFSSMSLFSERKVYIILEFDRLHESLWDIFFQTIKTNRESIFLLSSSKSLAKSPAQLKKFINSLEFKLSYLSIKSLTPWDDKNLLQFLLKECKLKLDNESKNFIFNNVEFSFEEYSTLLRLLKLHYPDPDQVINLTHVKELVVQSRVDRFEVAYAYFSADGKNPFVDSLMNLNLPLSDYLPLIGFLKSQLVKLLDKELMDQASLKKYEQRLFAAASKLSHKQLLDKLNELERFEINLKDQNIFAYEDFKRQSLTSF